MNDIIVNDITKYFKFVKQPKDGSFNKIFNYFLPDYETFKAVDNISFSIKKGEKVAFLGPNGAGKSTTMKILTGIMNPTSGTVEILNINPHTQRKLLSKDIGVVMSHYSQLWYHLPLYQSFELLAAIHDLKTEEFRIRISYLAQKFDVEKLFTRSVNKLSLGERMKCEIIASLIHSPKILFFDEPTIGLDIVAKANMRDIIIDMVEKDEITFILTSHDINDIEKICNRVIIIDKGKIISNSSIKEMKNNFSKKIIIAITSDKQINPWFMNGATFFDYSKYNAKIEIDLSITSKESVLTEILEKCSVKDISFESVSLENIMKNFYEH